VFDFSSLLLKQPPSSPSFFSKSPHAAVSWDGEGCTVGRVQPLTSFHHHFITWILCNVIASTCLISESSKTMQESVGLQWEWDHFSKLHHLTYQIQEKEAARDSSDCMDNEKKRMDAIQPFMDWLEIHDVNTSKLRIRKVGNNSGLGLVTKVPIKAGDEVLLIPEKIMMTTTNARESKLSKRHKHPYSFVFAPSFLDS